MRQAQQVTVPTAPFRDLIECQTGSVFPTMGVTTGVTIQSRLTVSRVTAIVLP